MGRSFALHVVDLWLISSIPPNTPGVISKHRTKSNPRAPLEVTPNKANKYIYIFNQYRLSIFLNRGVMVYNNINIITVLSSSAIALPVSTKPFKVPFPRLSALPWQKRFLVQLAISQSLQSLTTFIMTIKEKERKKQGKVKWKKKGKKRRGLLLNNNCGYYSS